MYISTLVLKNWRNFRSVNIAMSERMFVVGPNASGKSNLLDALRFLRDIAKPEGGGLQKAIRDRGGLSKVRCLAARKETDIRIEITLDDIGSPQMQWRYMLAIKQQPRGERLPFVSHESVDLNGVNVFTRPDAEDKSDELRLTQTFLEQINTNSQFREIAKFLQSITYLHLVPQLLRYADAFQGKRLEDDPFGQGMLESIARTPENVRRGRLKRLEDALRVAVPQMKRLQFIRDEHTGKPHLEALSAHWRPNAGWQREDQFSDGTLRLIGLLWCLLERDSLLLLEEPELSLNASIVQKLAPLIARTQRQRRRQIILSTHSADLLVDRGIAPSEIVLLVPSSEGTDAQVAANHREVSLLMEKGMSPGEAVLPLNRPSEIEQLALFE